MDNSNRETWNTKQMVADVDATNTGGKAIMGFKLGKHYLSGGLDFEKIYKDGVRTMTMHMMGGTSTKKFNLWNKAVIQNAGLMAGYNSVFGLYAVNAGLRMDFNKADSEDTLVLIKNCLLYTSRCV